MMALLSCTSTSQAGMLSATLRAALRTASVRCGHGLWSACLSCSFYMFFCSPCQIYIARNLLRVQDSGYVMLVGSPVHRLACDLQHLRHDCRLSARGPFAVGAGSFFGSGRRWNYLEQIIKHVMRTIVSWQKTRKATQYVCQKQEWVLLPLRSLTAPGISTLVSVAEVAPWASSWCLHLYIGQLSF